MVRTIRAMAGLFLAGVLLGACGASGTDGSAPVATRRAAPSTTTSVPASTTTTTVVGRVAVGALAPVALAPAAAAPPARTAPPAAATGRSTLTVADAGNSILFDAEPAIGAALGDARFFPHTIGGFGISVLPEMWRGVFGNDVPANDPDVVLVMLGNRDFPVALAQPDLYRAQLDESVRMLSSRGARVLWLGLPPLPPNPLDERGRDAVNALFAELPARFPGVVRYVPTDAVLGNPDGTWARTAPGSPEPIRKVNPDGTPEEHLCPAGAVRLAELIRSELASFVTVPTAPAGWERSPWRTDPRYDDPVGSCA